MALESSAKNNRPPIINLSLFTHFSESFSSDHGSMKSQNSVTDFKPQMKSPRNFQGGVVGLGIVAAMNEINDTHEAFTSAKPNRASAQVVISPRSKPIPIAFAKPISKFQEPISEKDEFEMENLSESYTCVISRIGNNSIVKREYFEKPDDSSSVFIASPPKYPEMEIPFQDADFLNSCFLCKKNLLGLDIFMYKGDKAFCSTECRCKQILSDEHKEICGSGSLKKPCDYSVSPCSAPILFSAGVAAA